MIETVLSWLFPMTARLSPLSIATPLGALPTGIVEITACVLRFTIDTESDFSLATTAISVIGLICYATGIGFEGNG